MTDREFGDRRRVGQPQVHGGPPAPVPVLGDGDVVRHAAANGAEVKRDVSAVAAPVSGGLPARPDVVAKVAVGPEGAVAPADRAIAGRHRLGRRIECPVDLAAVAPSLQHRPLSAGFSPTGLMTGIVETAYSSLTR